VASRSEPGDPRPQLANRDGSAVVSGVRCTACSLPVAFSRPRCPACHGEVVPAQFGPTGVVWSATVVRIATPGREPPYALAYVDLDDGPRVLAHLSGDHAPDVGTRVRLAAASHRDLRVEVL